ncbi:MAG TPA: hypothetical protein EYH41_03630 [Novosphingobium capsulatum]|jgi:hypothetical protein|nr:hypothetical protein [Novosphingobium capsulatum]
MLPPPQCRSRLARNLLLLFRLPRGTRLRWGHAPKPLGFDATKLTGLSERLIRSHWKSNYQGSIKALNMAGGAPFECNDWQSGAPPRSGAPAFLSLT